MIWERILHNSTVPGTLSEKAEEAPIAVLQSFREGLNFL